MESVPLLLVVLAAAAALLVIGGLVLAGWRGRKVLPFTKRPSLLTPGERRFYATLVQAVPPGVVIFVKVRLLDVVTVPEAAWESCGAPASGMHLDFVLADASTTEPRLAIELDDRSHVRADVRQRDRFKDTALKAAGVPMLRVPAAGRYNGAELRAQIRAALEAR
jgi:hypothetical protein